ncbi:MBL fold metallo-hydrolase [Nocardioides lijunqiniae]|uniref:MBL fold metallo-hydrolase n=1 Tax=Nocardioides lijunqiniae TaxID=2760832 RepID=UPI0018788338
MREIAPGVQLLRGRPPHMVNCYLVGDVLVDAGTPGARKRLLRELSGHPVTAHAVTHAHPDHFGSSRAVCEAMDLPLWCGAADAEAIETATPAIGPGLVPRLMSHLPKVPSYAVSRGLVEGDAVAGFEVLEVPGHSPGHIALWRESDRVLIAGDVFFHLGRVTAPWSFLTADVAVNRASMRRLAALRPALALFGHGPPLRDPDVLERVAAR